MTAQRKTKIVPLILIIGILSLSLVGVVSAQLGMAPDGTVAPMPAVPITETEYKYDDDVIADVIAGRRVEVWARIYRPTTLDSPPYPLVVMLHGNHGTCGTGAAPRTDDNCDYTTTGTCPVGYVVTPNHMGYTYIARVLAQWGYIVVSINANRGITCGAGIAGDPRLIRARGRLVLKHIEYLSDVNRGVAVPGTTTNPGTAPIPAVLRNMIDFGSVGLMGHSRGGEGMRAAINLYNDVAEGWSGPGGRIGDLVTFQSVFEIGPTDNGADGIGSPLYDANGTTWNVLLPMCDGDVATLSGVRSFDRMLRVNNEDYVTPKSTYTVWGANHNFFNTEWQRTDPGGDMCIGHARLPATPAGDSPQQQTIGLASVAAFFRGTVFGSGYDSTFMQNFNPQYTLPAVVTGVTRVDRGYTESPNSAITSPLEDFTGGAGTTLTPSMITFSRDVVPRHDAGLRAGLISWPAAGAARYLQSTWAVRDISLYQTLDLRVSRQNDPLNPAGATNFSIRLIHSGGALSGAAQLNTYTDLRGPVGGPGGRHPILQTARIPLTAFTGADLTRVEGVRLTFDDTASGAIYVANIRVSMLSGSPWVGASEVEVADRFLEPYPYSGLYRLEEKPVAPAPDDAVNIISSIRTVPSASILEDQPGIEIEVTSTRSFPVANHGAVLHIGAKKFARDRYSEDGRTNTLIFTLTPEEFAQIATGDPVVVQYSFEEPSVLRDLGRKDQWDFGRLDKSLLDK